MKEEVIAVFDIGMTNKKFLVFNKNFEVLHQEERRMESIEDDDGEEAEDLETLTQWMQTTFNHFLQHSAHRLIATNVSTHGASLVYTDEKGTPVAPLYSYLKKAPEGLSTSFFGKYGPKEPFLATTASPDLGMLNSGMQLYWLKHWKPDLFAKTQYCFHLPQYCAFLLSGRKHAEMTSIGCHTFMWDFPREQYHQWIVDEGLEQYFPPISSTTHTDLVEREGQSFEAGIGIHDSSAALVPYLMAIDDPFIMLSTGTWSIAMNPFNSEPLTEEELAQDCLSYINFEGNAVKSSRVFLGNEYEFQEKRLAKHFGKTADYHKQVHFDPILVHENLKSLAPDRRFYPQKMEGTGPFPIKKTDQLELGAFANYEEAYHQLMLDLVGIQVASLKLILGQSPVKKIFLSGGFSANELFPNLLAAFLPGIEICMGTISRATALGAALVVSPNWQKNLKENLNFRKWSDLVGADLQDYPVPF